MVVGREEGVKGWEIIEATQLGWFERQAAARERR
jgi:hypothetical protein